MQSHSILFLMFASFWAQRLTAQQPIGFLEKFALSENRDQTLEDLVPGTQEAFHFKALNLQNQGKSAEFWKLLKDWGKAFPNGGKDWDALMHRQVLLDYQTDPQASLQNLIQTIRPKLDHQRALGDRKPDLPIVLNQKIISDEAYYKLNTSNDPSLTNLGLTELENLVRTGANLTVQQRRGLLGRLERPDVTGLSKLVITDLLSKDSPGFGAHPIHTKLLGDQLDEVAKAVPALLSQQNFVNIRLGKWRPSAETDVLMDLPARAAWLDQLWAYAKDLPPAMNSLKAHLLYQKLDLGRRTGQYDPDLLQTYLKLPRPVPYVSPRWQRDAPEDWRWTADLNADFSNITMSPAIGTDEGIVRDHLLRIFEKAPDYTAYLPWLEEGWLRRIFAESKITSGQNESGEYTAWLSPADYSALRDRTDIQWDPSNPSVFAPGDDIKLHVALKNTPGLTLKFFEINTEGWFENHAQPFGTDLDLDGLIPLAEKEIPRDKPPVRRTVETLALDSIPKRRGVWIVELIGNGRSSRALIRRGGMQYLPRLSVNGTVFTITDENGGPLPKAFATLEGRRFPPDPKSGEILIPHTTKPGIKPVVLHDGEGFATLEKMALTKESYKLEAGFQVDHESLLSGATTVVAVRPRLLCAGIPVPPSLITDGKLEITSFSLDGITATSVVDNPKLSPKEEFLHEFTVPARLNRLTFTLRGKVRNQSEGNEDLVSASGSFTVNGVEKSAAIADAYLGRDGANWIVDVRGKNGEPLPETPLSFTLSHLGYAQPVVLALKTNAEGRVNLGPLLHIARVEVSSDILPLFKNWMLSDHAETAPNTIHATADDVIRLPWFCGEKAGEADFSLLEVRNGDFVANAAGKATVKNGVLEIQGLPPGDYLYFDRLTQVERNLSVSPGKRVRNFLLSNRRMLEVTSLEPLSIPSVTTENGNLIVRIAGGGSNTRVHIVAARYQSEWNALKNLGSVTNPGLITGILPAPLSQYVSGRDIGEEYRYILERQKLTPRVGVMLPRPGLLLNPWSIRDTDAGQQVAQVGEGYERAKDMAERQMSHGAQAPVDSAALKSDQESDVSASFNWLADSSATAYNISPDPDKVLRIPLDQFRDATMVTITALDDRDGASRVHALPATPIKTRDLRLAAPLDLTKKFTQVDEALALPADKPFVIQDALSARFQTYASLSDVFTLLQNLQPSSSLSEFAFLKDWPELAEDRRLELYAQYACHELNFFLARKDPVFFKKVVQPYLANKKDRTFMDDYLLENDLHRYLEPWEHDRLNMAERILLGQRIKDQEAAEKRHIQDLMARVPVNRDEDRRLQETAVFGLNLERGRSVSGGILEERAEAEMPFAASAPVTVDEEPRMRGYQRSLLLAKKAGGKPAKKSDRDGMGLDEQLATMTPENEVVTEGLGKQAAQPFFRPLEKTKEWAENNYYKLRIVDQTSDLVPINKFWADYATWDGKSPFLSAHVPEAAGSLSEMILALAVLDLPFAAQADKVATNVKNGALTLKPKTPLLLFQQQIRPARKDPEAPRLLVSQDFYRLNERYIEKDGERMDRFVTKEFLVGVAYGAQLVITNPTSALQKLDVLFQIPAGSLPLEGGKTTQSFPLNLQPYHTVTLNTAFYFPKPGNFPHYPVTVGRNNAVVAAADTFVFHVVAEPSEADAESWEYVSQRGGNEDVLKYLDAHNLADVNLEAVAWRVRESADFFNALLKLLRNRRVYNESIYAYGLVHNNPAAIREFLLHEEEFLDKCGPSVDCALVTADPIDRRGYEHLEYEPLVNARAHRLGAERQIMNGTFWEQYMAFLSILSYEKEPTPVQELALTYYLLLQDRVDEAKVRFAKVKGPGLDLQRDYASAWLAMADDDAAAARAIAAKYAAYPVPKWREKFARVIEQLDEAAGVAGALTGQNREDQQNALSDATPVIELKAEEKHAVLATRNVEEATANFYLMDLEFLFSSNPFVSQDSSRFATIKPNKTATLKLNPKTSEIPVELPEEYKNRNVLVEIVAAGQRKAVAIFANSLRADFAEAYGIVQVIGAVDGKPLPRTYVKVYALVDGKAVFHKDGYTDSRGKFDYVSLNEGENNAAKFSVLLINREHGALVKEVNPPNR